MDGRGSSAISPSSAPHGTPRCRVAALPCGPARPGMDPAPPDAARQRQRAVNGSEAEGAAPTGKSRTAPSSAQAGLNSREIGGAAGCSRRPGGLRGVSLSAFQVRIRAGVCLQRACSAHRQFAGTVSLALCSSSANRGGTAASRRSKMCSSACGSTPGEARCRQVR